MKFFHIYDFLIFKTRTTPGAEKPARQTNPQPEGFTHILEVDLALLNIPHILEVDLAILEVDLALENIPHILEVYPHSTRKMKY